MNRLRNGRLRAYDSGCIRLYRRNLEVSRAWVHHFQGQRYVMWRSLEAGKHWQSGRKNDITEKGMMRQWEVGEGESSLTTQFPCTHFFSSFLLSTEHRVPSWKNGPRGTTQLALFKHLKPQSSCSAKKQFSIGRLNHMSWWDSSTLLAFFKNRPIVLLYIFFVKIVTS